jgi:hypothetical protein
MWVDRRTSELREVTFRYVNAGLLSRFKAGGYTRFLRLPSGAWIVSEWRLSAPTLELRRGLSDRVVQTGRVETGGATLSSERASLLLGQLATVTGVIYDSLTHRPLSDAKVVLGNRTAISDQSGRFTFAGIPAGTGIVSFSHPVLQSFGVVALQREIAMMADTTEVALATPSLRTLWGAMCSGSEAREYRPNRGILHGFVRQQNGDPAPNTLVEIHWTERTPEPTLGATVARLELRVFTGTDGHYSACGFRPLSRGSAVATKENANSARVEFDFRSSLSLLLRRDLELIGPAGAPHRD